MNITYTKIRITDNNKKQHLSTLQKLVSLSKIWFDEGLCSSYFRNGESDYIDRELYIAICNGDIIAYALGDINVLNEKTSYNNIGETVFELDELFVVPKYRKNKVGHNLFLHIEADLSDKVDIIALQANSKNYSELLDFYINDLGMDFIYVLLTKRIKEKTNEMDVHNE